MRMRVANRVLMVVVSHGSLHMGMWVLVQGTHAVRVREQGIAWGCRWLSMTWGAKCWMMRRTSPW